MATVRDLTGGTGDVNPQILNLTVVQTAADATTTLEQPLPLPRFSAKKGRSLVVEVLWVQWNFDDIRYIVGNFSYTGILSTAPTAATVTDPRTFAVLDFEGSQNAAAASFRTTPRTYRQILHDGAGHGILVATDNIYLTLITTGPTTVINSLNVKLAYRYKEVNLEEYLGIVSSQQ